MPAILLTFTESYYSINMSCFGITVATAKGEREESREEGGLII